MSPFASNTLRQLNQNIDSLFTRMSATNCLSLGYDEFLRTFATAEHARILKSIRDVAFIGPVPSSRYVNWTLLPEDGSGNTDHLERFEMQVRFPYPGHGHGNEHHPPPPFPLKPTLQPGADPDVVARINSWVKTQFELATDFGRIRFLLGKLNDACTSKHQVRYVWPSILTVCREDPATADLGERLAELKVPKNPPSLNPATRQACRQAAQTLAMCSLLPAETAEPDAAPVVFSSLKEQIVDEPIGKFFILEQRAR